MALKTHSATLSHGKVKLRVACSHTAQGSCHGVVKLHFGGHDAGKVTFSGLHSGASRVVSIHLTRSLGGHSVNASVRMDARDSSNRHKVTHGSATIHPPPHH
jgi:hypothetical protein